MNSDRYERGRKLLDSINSQAGERILESLQDIAPDMVQYIFEFPFGDLYSRPGLDLKSRELATVASLVALGNAQTELKAHLHIALNVGWTREELVEVMMQLAVYAGFPAALNALHTAKEVFREREAQPEKKD
jgi:4-carboxymuconolactone decarboxylase